MKQIGRAVCPYCGKKVNLAVAWGLRRRGEYSCPRCHGISNVFLTGTAVAAAFLAVAASVLILFCLLFLLQEAVWWSILAVLAPYVLFYLLSLFCVQLKKPVFRRTSSGGEPRAKTEVSSPKRRDSSGSERDTLGDTRVL